MKRLLTTSIRIYQLSLSALLGDRCRFYPSCSEYARQAIELHGLAGGTWLATKRISRCHPFHSGGVDLVPEPEQAGKV